MRSFADGARSRWSVAREAIPDPEGPDRGRTGARPHHDAGVRVVRTGSAPDANSIPVPKAAAEEAMDARPASLRACVAAARTAPRCCCLGKGVPAALLPQGEPDGGSASSHDRTDGAEGSRMLEHYACEAECPKQISVEHIARLNANTSGRGAVTVHPMAGPPAMGPSMSPYQGQATTSA